MIAYTVCVPELVTFGAIREAVNVPVELVITLTLPVENLGFHRIVMFVFAGNPDPVILSVCPEITGFGEPVIVHAPQLLVETEVVVELVVEVLVVLEVVELVVEVVVDEVVEVEVVVVVVVLDVVVVEVTTAGIVAVEK